MAASDYKTVANAVLCPIGILASAVGYSTTRLLLSSLRNVRPGDVTVGMAAMINNEIVKVTGIDGPLVTVLRGCADTVPRVHAAGSPVWFFGGSMGTDNKVYMATDTVAVKLLPYTTSGNTMPVTASPPNNVTMNFRLDRPYPPGNMQCQGTPWFSGVKTMALGQDTLTWTWAHRDRIQQADQLVGHLEASIGPEPGTTYVVTVRTIDDVVLRTVTGITGTTWTYTREMVEEDLHELPEAYVDISARRGTLDSWNRYRTLVRLVGGNRVVVSFGGMGWPGVLTNCGPDGSGALTNGGTQSWGSLDVAWSGTEESWANTPTSPIVFESTPYDLGAVGEYRLLLGGAARGVLSVTYSTSSDGLTYNDWATPLSGYVTTRFVKARYTVAGTDPLLASATLSYFRRS